MKIFLQICGQENIEEAIKAAAVLFGHEVIENIEEAELMVVNSAKIGLNLLKENEDATLVSVLMSNDDREEKAFRSLARNFSGRVDICHIIAPENSDEMSLVVYFAVKGGCADENSAC